MPELFERRILPYTPVQMFDLVADIERYPAFLPWCRVVRVIQRNGEELTTTLEAGTKVINGTFTSIVKFERPKRIVVTYVGGPLKHLFNEWSFAPHERGCEVTFALDFTFKSAVLGGMMNLAFEKAFRTMAEAFEKRAKAIYS